MISIITLFSWIDNDLDMLKHSVEKIFQNTTEDFELIILDNDCLPETRWWLNTLQDSKIKIVHLLRRMGVPEAYNYGIGQVRSDWIYVFDSDICPNIKDWTQIARNFRPQQDWAKYCFNIPLGWFIDKSVHVKTVCDFYQSLKDKIVPNLNDSIEFHKDIRSRLESVIDYFDRGIVYQSYDSDMYLVLKLAGIQKLFAEFMALPISQRPLTWNGEWNGERPKEDPDTWKIKVGYLTVKSRAYMATKWKMIRTFGGLSAEQIQTIDNHRPESGIWMEYYVDLWAKAKDGWEKK